MVISFFQKDREEGENEREEGGREGRYRGDRGKRGRGMEGCRVRSGEREGERTDRTEIISTYRLSLKVLLLLLFSKRKEGRRGGRGGKGKGDMGDGVMDGYMNSESCMITDVPTAFTAPAQ